MTNLDVIIGLGKTKLKKQAGIVQYEKYFDYG